MAPAPTRARLVALQILRAILHDRRSLADAIAGNRGFATLAVRDRGFVRLLVSTVLRRLGQIDAAIDACLDRPLKPRLREPRDLLRLGAVQILFLGTPAHAAVDTTVALAGQRRLYGFRALLNAVLRRLADEGAGLVAAQDAARLSTPPWLWDRLCAAYGETTTRAIAEAHLSEPPLDLSVKADAAVWAKRLAATQLPTGGLRLPPGSGEVSRLDGYAEGGWWVQDAAASLPARLLGAVRGKRVIDLCAAPGGKTAELAAAGAEVIAVDQSPERMQRLQANLERLQLAAATVVADAVDWRPPAPGQAVLLDAPCSATGTLRRHPDIAHLKSAAEIVALTKIQDRLLRAAVAMTAPGGLLVYATCSLLPEEGEQRIAALLDEQQGALARVPVDAAEIGSLTELITAQGDLRSLPCHLADQGGLDGFYACRLRRL